MIKAKLFNEKSGEVTEVTPENGSDFNLQELYKLIGCEIIEVVRIPSHGKSPEMIAICDEEGAFGEDKDVNISFNTFIFSGYGLDLCIVGNVVFCSPEMLK